MEHRKYLDRKDEEGVQSEGWISKRKRKSIKPAWSHRYMKVSNRAILMANSPPDIALSSKVFGLHTLRRVYSSRDEHGNPTGSHFFLLPLIMYPLKMRRKPFHNAFVPMSVQKEKCNREAKEGSR